MTQEECCQIVKEWHNAKGHHSFHHTICNGEQYDKLLAAGTEVVPFLLELLKTDIWMGIQGLLCDITHADIWEGTIVAPGWRGYNVKASAEKWIEWGKKQGLIA